MTSDVNDRIMELATMIVNDRYFNVPVTLSTKNKEIEDWIQIIKEKIFPITIINK